MSVLLKTDLTEYARQCTLQRRRYEECLQEAQRNGIDQDTASSACLMTQTEVEVQTETSALDEDTEPVAQGSLADLLGLSAEPCAWDDKPAASYDASNGVMKAQQWHSDRAQFTQHHTSSAPKNVSSVSYGAP